MSKSQRTKGATGEREVCHRLAPILGEKVCRNLFQWREGGCDIILGSLHLEVKRRASLSVYSFMEQAKRSCKNGETPVVFMRADRKPWLIMMLADDVLNPIEKYLDSLSDADRRRLLAKYGISQ